MRGISALIRNCMKIEKKYPQKEYLVKRNGNLVDTTFMLTNVPIRINDLWIPDCKVTYRPGFDTNLLGVGFIERFNFMLGYQKGNKNSSEGRSLFTTTKNRLKIQ